MQFDPNGTGQSDLGVFSLPYTEDQAKLVFVPVPWEVTTSFGNGCSRGAEAIYTASKQLDLCDALLGSFFEQGIFQREVDAQWLKLNDTLKLKAQAIKETLERGESLQPSQIEDQKQINRESQRLNDWLYRQSLDLIKAGKFCAAIGGDHSAPLGLIRALSETYPKLSILHIDAHHDLRVAFQGYTYSHASIMYNVLQETSISSLVQMGIRDFCPQEQHLAQEDPRIHCWYDSQVAWELAQGKTWLEVVQAALSKLSDHVYISFDIDGLAPDLCPSTGTPVPGGLSFAQMEALFYALATSGRRIVGFDLCEVSPESTDYQSSWDANVGARVLFKLAGALFKSQTS